MDRLERHMGVSEMGLRGNDLRGHWVDHSWCYGRIGEDIVVSRSIRHEMLHTATAMANCGRILLAEEIVNRGHCHIATSEGTWDCSLLPYGYLEMPCLRQRPTLKNDVCRETFLETCALGSPEATVDVSASWTTDDQNPRHGGRHEAIGGRDEMKKAGFQVRGSDCVIVVGVCLLEPKVHGPRAWSQPRTWLEIECVIDACLPSALAISETVRDDGVMVSVAHARDAGRISSRWTRGCSPLSWPVDFCPSSFSFGLSLSEMDFGFDGAWLLMENCGWFDHDSDSGSGDVTCPRTRGGAPSRLGNEG